jgi:hypothetical protein
MVFGAVPGPSPENFAARSSTSPRKERGEVTIPSL